MPITTKAEANALLKQLTPQDVVDYLIEEDDNMRAVVEVGLQLHHDEQREARDRRDRFAMAALTGMLATAGAPLLTGLDGIEPHVAVAAYKMADAMLAQADQ